LSVAKTIRFHAENDALLIELAAQENLSQTQIVNIVLRRFGRVAFPARDATPMMPPLQYQPRN
jgi:hypothetical protein